MNQELSTHDKVLGAMEDAAMYQELGKDARDRASGAKKAWTKQRDRLDRAKQDQQLWRQGHKISSWLHDNGWWPSKELVKREDRERHLTTREADAHTAHLDARDDMRRMDTKLARSQEEASNGWRKLEQEKEREEEQLRREQERQSQAKTHSKSQQHDQAKPEQHQERPAKADRFVGELLDAGEAPYLNDTTKGQSYFVTLRTDDGKEVTHWGVDLKRAHEETYAVVGDRIHVEKNGRDQSVEVKEGDVSIPATRRGWTITNLSREQVLEQEYEHEPVVAPEPAIGQEAAAEHASPEPALAHEPVVEHTSPEPAVAHEPIARGTFAQRVQMPRSAALDRIRAGAAQREPETDEEWEQEQARLWREDPDYWSGMTAEYPDPAEREATLFASIEEDEESRRRFLGQQQEALDPTQGGPLDRAEQSFQDRGQDLNARTAVQANGVDAIDIFNAGELTQEPLAHSATTQERQQSMSQTQTFGSIELPRTKQELQKEQSRLSLGNRVMETNISFPEPGRRPSLSERIRQIETPSQSQDDQGQGSGGRHGGQERPSHSSFYQPVPVGGMAPPTTDERSADIQQQERRRQRDRGRSM